MNQKGITIMEAMLASALAVVFTLGFASATQAFRTQMTRQDYYYDTNRASRIALDRLSEDAKEALRIESTRNGFTTGNSTLILRLPSVNVNGDATNIDSQYDYVTYRHDSANSRLLRDLDLLDGTSVREGGADITGEVVAKNVSTVSFSSAGTALGSYAAGALAGLQYLNVQIQNQGTLMGSTMNTEADTDIMLRNNI